MWQYYQEQLGRVAVDAKEFIRLAEQMLQIGYTLEEVAAAFEHSKERNRDEIETFIRYILTERISVYYLDKKEVYTPGNVEGQMVFIFDALLGYNRNKYELSEVERVELADRLKSIFPDRVKDVNDITIDATEKKKEKVQQYEAYLEMLNTKLDQQRDYLENYDIVATHDLISWEKGDTVAPDVEDWLKEVGKILQIVDEELKEMNELLQKLRASDTLEYMLREESSKFLLPKVFWEYINENRDNDKVLMVIVILLRVDVTGANIYNLIKYILCNPKLIEDYFLEQIG